MKLINTVMAGLVLASTALISSTAMAQVKERTMRFAFQNIADTPQGRGAAKFADLLKEKSGGKFNIRLFPAGQLGGDLPTVSALQGGTIDITVLNAGLLVGLNKEFAVLDLPFLFASPEEADKIVDGPIGQKLHKLVEDKGLIGLGYWELGFRNVTNSRRPITKIEDFSGIKIRVLQSPLFIETFQALGANAVPMPFPELYAALEQRVVDGQENPFPTIVGAKLNEVQKFLSSTQHIYNAQSLLISKKAWDDMSAEEKKIVQDAANEARDFQRKNSRDSMGSALATLKAAGMQHNEIAPAEMARIREKVAPVVAKFGAVAGDALYAEVQAELAKMRK
ncbi:MAG: TRAP transporter substrate-binding protein [Bosea sp. (in: a-proteobacteria)]